MSGTEPLPVLIRVMLVDEHALVREGIRQILEKEPDLLVVGEADRGEVALGLLDDLHPDVVLLEVRMPGMSGVETTRRIHEAFPKIRVLILSARGDFALEALRAGASGYLLKTSNSRQLVAALRSVFFGSTVIQGANSPTCRVAPGAKAMRRATQRTKLMPSPKRCQTQASSPSG